MSQTPNNLLEIINQQQKQIQELREAISRLERKVAANVRLTERVKHRNFQLMNEVQALRYNRS